MKNTNINPNKTKFNLTNAGMTLDAKLQARGLPLKITRIVTASGDVSSVDPLTMTDVIELQQRFIIENIFEDKKSWFIHAYVSNYGDDDTTPPSPPVQEGYSITHIGMFAEDPDVGEILMRVRVLDMPIPMLDHTKPYMKYEQTWEFVTANVPEIHAEINPRRFMRRVPEAATGSVAVFDGKSGQVVEGYSVVNRAGGNNFVVKDLIWGEVNEYIETHLNGRTFFGNTSLTFDVDTSADVVIRDISVVGGKFTVEILNSNQFLNIEFKSAPDVKVGFIDGASVGEVKFAHCRSGEIVSVSGGGGIDGNLIVKDTPFKSGIVSVNGGTVLDGADAFFKNAYLTHLKIVEGSTVEFSGSYAVDIVNNGRFIADNVANSVQDYENLPKQKNGLVFDKSGQFETYSRNGGA